MALAEVALLVCLVLGLLYLLLRHAAPSRRPLPAGVRHVRGVPFLGAAASLSRDCDGFFARNGPAFAMYLFQQPMLVLTHLSDVQHIYKHTREFSIEEPQADITYFVTGIARERMLALPSQRIHGLWPKFLSHPGLAPTSASVVRRLLDETVSGAPGTLVGDALARGGRRSDGGWAVVPKLFDLTYRVVFVAGVPGVLGAGIADPRTLVDAMRAFDDAMPLMVAGAPAFLTRAGARGRDALARAIGDQLGRGGLWAPHPEPALLEDGTPVVSPLQFERTLLYLDSKQLSHDDIAQGGALIMWVIHTNSAPAAFWLLTFLLSHPTALAAVLAEIDAVADAYPNFPLELPSVTNDDGTALTTASELAGDVSAPGSAGVSPARGARPLSAAGGSPLSAAGGSPLSTGPALGSPVGASPGLGSPLSASKTSSSLVASGAVYDKLLPVLTSAAWETLRLRISAFSTRTVMAPCTVPLSTGETCSLNVGDQVLIAPGHHKDPTIFADPHTFNYARFLPDPATGKRPEFYQDGVLLRSPVFCFGGGGHMCPGRFLALNEMRTYAFAMLRNWEMELVGPAPSPASRPGLGVLPPNGDVGVRMRRRSHPSGK